MPAEGKVDGLAVSGEEWIEGQSFCIVELHQRRWRAAIDRRLGDDALSVGRDDAKVKFPAIRAPAFDCCHLSKRRRQRNCAHRMRRSWTELEQKVAEGLYAGIDNIPRQQQEVGYGGLSLSNTTGQSDLSRIADMSDADNSTIAPI